MRILSTLANSFGTILRFSSEPIESVDITKRKLLYKIILFINLFGIPAVAFAVIESIFLKQYIIAFSYIVFYSPILIVTIIQKKLSYKVLVFVPIIITYLLGTINLVIWGFSGAGVPLLLTLLVLATVFYNMKVGMITLVINLFTIIAVGMLYLYNVLTLSVKLQEIMHQPISWITAWSILTLLGLLIVFSDNGVGFPKHFLFPGKNSLGLVIVENLVKQINGTLEISSNHGLAYTIIFPVKHQFRSYNPVRHSQKSPFYPD